MASGKRYGWDSDPSVPDFRACAHPLPTLLREAFLAERTAGPAMEGEERTWGRHIGDWSGEDSLRGLGVWVMVSQSDPGLGIGV